ncbi:MAG: hypothetical protein K1X94_35415 [Sandaracinaceae bacterium]|jgi:hypothetical protein|nr:hypothetical protein [Sandaracinaceae bacterium]
MVGKPRGEVARNVVITLRLTPDESKAWRLRARRAGVTMAEWLRDLAARDIARAVAKTKKEE